ncbi:MAG: transcriptional regulator [Actinobacteria bacterium]|nr:MAG: transcriptional regulator [Actinomycetota bacterium]
MRKFDQYCPVAHALSLVGDRWSLLIVRELLHGPKRYTDLTNGLPGIGTNILAARLRDLEESGVVQKRTLPPPAASTVYELTEYGAGLKEALYALARWGARTIGPPGPDDELYPEWGVNALPALFDANAARGLTETYALVVDGDAFSARVVDGSLEAMMGAAKDADVVVEMNMETFFGLASGELAPRNAVKSGRARVQGSLEALERCFRVLSLAPRATTAAA